MQIQLNDEQLNQSIQEAVLLSISDAAKERMIADAIKHLVAPDKNFRGDMSPLQRAFQDAAASAARSMLLEEFNNPESEANQMVRRMVTDALAKMTTSSVYSDLIDSFATALSRVFSGNR